MNIYPDRPNPISNNQIMAHALARTLNTQKADRRSCRFRCMIT